MIAKLPEIDNKELGRFVTCGGLIHVERHARAAYRLINDIDSPPKRKRKTQGRQTALEHLTAIESIVASVRRYLADGVEPIRQAGGQ